MSRSVAIDTVLVSSSNVELIVDATLLELERIWDLPEVQEVEQDPEQFLALLTTKVRDNYQYILKTQRRRRAREDQVSLYGLWGADIVAGEEPRVGDHADQIVERSVLLDLLEKIPDARQREVADAFFLDGLTVAETAALLGLDAQTVRRHRKNVEEFLRPLLPSSDRSEPGVERRDSSQRTKGASPRALSPSGFSEISKSQRGTERPIAQFTDPAGQSAEQHERAVPIGQDSEEPALGVVTLRVDKLRQVFSIAGFLSYGFATQLLSVAAGLLLLSVSRPASLALLGAGACLAVYTGWTFLATWRSFSELSLKGLAAPTADGGIS